MNVHAAVEPLAWESDFFGITSAKLIFDPAAAPLNAGALDAFEIVQAKVACDASAMLDALASLGFRLVEGEIDCSLMVSEPDYRPEADIAHSAGLLRVAGPVDSAAVCALAAKSLRISRFRAPWYRAGDSARFYALWAQKAITGDFDDLCLVKGTPAVIEGMVTLRRIAANEARIGLLAVEPAFAGQGIGRALIAGALAWCREHGVKRLRVATQTGNIAALRLYISCGANIDGTAYWLYR